MAGENKSPADPLQKSYTRDQLQENLQRALRDEDSHALLDAFLRLSRDSEYLEAVPATLLAEIIRNLRPRYFVEVAKLVYRGSHPTRINNLGDGTAQLKDVFFDYTEALNNLTARLRQVGKSIGIREYTALLNAAKATGNAESAIDILDSMHQAGIEPDTRCYNYFFEALAWSGAYEPINNYKLRVTPRNLALKRQAEQFVPMGGRLKCSTKSPGTLKKILLSTYEEMVKKGISANTSTYCSFLQVMGRDGDLASVKAVLMRVWDVDVDAIMNDQEGSLIFESKMEPDSPLYPSQHLLSTVAHIFGTNNQMSAALRVVDFIARKYELQIGLRTWFQLAEWTFVLSNRRFGTQPSQLKRRRNDSIGQLPTDSFETLWQTMTSEPYNVKPTEEMYNFRVKSFWRNNKRESMADTMDQFRSLFRAGKLTRLPIEDDLDSEFFMSAPEEQKLKRLSVILTDQTLRRWTRLMLTRFRPHKYWREEQFCDLPTFISRWFEYIDDIGAAYNLKLGHLQGRLQFHPTQTSSTMNMEIFRSPTNEVTAKPAKSYAGERPNLGLTRYRRLLRRNEYRTQRRTFDVYEDADQEENFEARSQASNIVPPWYERDNVRDFEKSTLLTKYAED